MTLTQLENEIAHIDTDSASAKDMKALYAMTRGTKFRIYQVDSLTKANLAEFFYMLQGDIAYGNI